MTSILTRDTQRRDKRSRKPSEDWKVRDTRVGRGKGGFSLRAFIWSMVLPTP